MNTKATPSMNTRNVRMSDVADAAGVHRERDGRLDVDHFSRRLMPRWKMVRVDGRYFDRKALGAWLLERKTSPITRRPLGARELVNATDPRPHRIFGKAPILDANLAAGGAGRFGA